MAFMAATSDSDALRIEGLKALEVCIQIKNLQLYVRMCLLNFIKNSGLTYISYKCKINKLCV